MLIFLFFYTNSTKFVTVAALYPPSTLFVPHFIKTDPKRLKKELPKSLKTIKSEDRLMLVGTTRCPFEAEMKPLMSCYQRIVLIPRPDYASRNCKYMMIT